MPEHPPHPAQRWIAGGYALGLLFTLLWTVRKGLAPGERGGLLLQVPVIVYVALLAWASLRMRPAEGRADSFAVLYPWIVGVHAAMGLVALVGLGTAPTQATLLDPEWASKLAMVGVLFGVVGSQVLHFVARRSRVFSLTNVGMLLYVLALPLFG